MINAVVRDTSGKLEYDNSSSLKMRSCKICQYHFTDRFKTRRHAQSKADKKATKIVNPIVTTSSKKSTRRCRSFEKITCSKKLYFWLKRWLTQVRALWNWKIKHVSLWESVIVLCYPNVDVPIYASSSQTKLNDLNPFKVLSKTRRTRVRRAIC